MYIIIIIIIYFESGKTAHMINEQKKE